MNINQQKKFALQLLEWHGGMNSGLYAVGSCMLSDAENDREYNPNNHRGHTDIAFPKALGELRGLRKNAKHPEAVTLKDEFECNALAEKFERNFGFFP